MNLMSHSGRSQGLAICLILLVLAWTSGCARPTGLQSDDGAAPTDQRQVPFHDVAEAPNTHPTDPPTAPDHPPNPDTALPFHDPQNLPAGTLLTVRLKTPISAQNPGVKGVFEAVVDEPVVIEGSKLVPRGAVVIGRVESARSSNVGNNRGYVRLALDSIRLGEINLPILTSSLFVRGNSSDARPDPGVASQLPSSSAVVHLEKGRRLTFRLTEPAYVAASQRTQVAR
jgi:hypothetical protein